MKTMVIPTKQYRFNSNDSLNYAQIFSYCQENEAAGYS